jgi:hypothetical protein
LALPSFFFLLSIWSIPKVPNKCSHPDSSFHKIFERHWFWGSEGKTSSSIIAGTPRKHLSPDKRCERDTLHASLFLARLSVESKAKLHCQDASHE